MLIEDVPKRDFEQIFTGVIVKDRNTGSWCKIEGFDEGKALLRPHLNKGGLSGDADFVEFTDENVSLETPSLGMCNTRNGAFFIQRKPSRVMKGGVVLDTCYVVNARSTRDADGHILKFDRRYAKLNHMFNREYPNLSESFTEAATSHRTIAFDRQFAVCWQGKVYYKGNTHPVGATDGVTIKFIPEFEILETVIGDNCAKSLYASKQAPKTRASRG
jgi:hypothetical protein